MDFLKNLSISDDKEAQKPVHAAAPEKEGLFDKIGDALGGRKTPPPAAPAPKENIFHKIGGALDGRKTPPPPPPAPVESDSIFDKIGNKLSGKQTPPPAPEPEQNLFSKIGDQLSGKKPEPAKPQGLFDHVNHALGGGAASEAKEGKLDKAIDLFQEHVLKSGSQDNESAVEQLKDKHIAETIRKTLGIEKKDQN
ncbi:hypothetical protein FA15DRAFT_693543 [Coprinopsis marcescibilis]|uniref:Uncharacterized protein n=1 Tax=Coprinopsis marcescibilis TaxID=230819 RepID=A0A5C3KZL2_COPMA|nr:hypothetical protein FA15DRAFT_693543 [Coprinopsis marcescibilis]